MTLARVSGWTQRCVSFGLAVSLIACVPTHSSEGCYGDCNTSSLEPLTPAAPVASLYPQSARASLGTDATPAPGSPEATEQLQSQMNDFAYTWFYGPGIGQTFLNVGTVVLFPYYAVYLLGNAGLTLAGYEPLYLTDALPEGARQSVNEVYSDVTSTPGRVNAHIADVEFQEHTPSPTLP